MKDLPPDWLERVHRILHVKVALLLRGNARLLAPQTSSDFVHDIWAHLLAGRLEKYDASRGSLEAFAATIAHNFMLDAIEAAKAKKRGGIPKTSEDEDNKDSKEGQDKEVIEIRMIELFENLPSNETSPEKLAMFRERVNKLLPALMAELTHSERLFFGYFFVDEKSYEEISIIMKAKTTSLQNVKADIVRKARQLRDKLKF